MLWLVKKPHDYWLNVLLTGSAQFDCKSAGCEDPDSPKCYGTCTHKNYVNDNITDCADGSDEDITGMCSFSKLSIIIKICWCVIIWLIHCIN